MSSPSGSAPLLPPPSASRPPSTPPRPRRPAFGFVIAAGVAVGLLRVFAGELGGQPAAALVPAALAVGIIGWRIRGRLLARRRGGLELSSADVGEQLRRAGGVTPAFPEDGTLAGASVLVVGQRSKLVEVRTQYDVFGADGNVLARVQQVGQSTAKQAARLFTSFDQFLTHRFVVTEADGRVALHLTRPAKLYRSRVLVAGPDGRELGSLRQLNVFGHIRFGLFDATGLPLGEVRAENWRAWDFVVELPSGHEVARITKNWEGWARTFASTADRYVVRIHDRLGDPLRSLVLATALSVDLALKQDARGWG